MVCNIVVVRVCQFRDDRLVFRVQDLNDLLEHLNPAGNRLICVFEGKLGDLPAGQFILFLECIRFQLFLLRFEIRDRRGLDLQGSAHEILAPLFQFGQSPSILLDQPDIHPDPAVLKAVLHRFLLGE